MPSITLPNGEVRRIPGVYDTMKVVSSLTGPLPAFQIPMIAGRAVEGHPYNADASKFTEENAFTPFHFCGTADEVASYYGPASEVSRAAKFSWRHGLPMAWVVNLAPLTRASVIVTSTGPVNQVKLAPKKWGAPGSWIKVAWAANVLTVTPVRYYALISANVAAGGTRIYVNGNHSWLQEGQVVIVGANAVAGVAKTIVASGTERQANGQIRQWIDIDTTAGALTTAGYGIVLVYDLDHVENHDAATTQALLDNVNRDSDVLSAHAEATFTGIAAPLAQVEKAIKEAATWATATAGTSPAPTSTDSAAFIASRGTWWPQFAKRNQVIPRAWFLVSSDEAVHEDFRDYAIAERTRGYPIEVTSGCAWGDVDVAASDTTNPGDRAETLNCQDFHLCAGGLDGEGAFISMAGAVFGRIVSGGPGHNITHDSLIYSELEVEWDELVAGELSYLCTKGVVTYNLVIGQSIQYLICQGLNTLQNNNGTVWNVEDATTWSIMQRDLADFVARVIKTDYESLQIGADEVTLDSVKSILVRRAERSLKKRKYIVSFKINSIAVNDAGSGYDVDWGAKLRGLNDYIHVTQNILIGDDA